MLLQARRTAATSSASIPKLNFILFLIIEYSEIKISSYFVFDEYAVLIESSTKRIRRDQCVDTLFVDDTASEDVLDVRRSL